MSASASRVVTDTAHNVAAAEVLSFPGTEPESHGMNAEGLASLASGSALDLSSLVAQIQETARARKLVQETQKGITLRLKSHARRHFAATIDPDAKSRDKMIRTSADKLVKAILAGKEVATEEAFGLLEYHAELLQMYALAEAGVKRQTKQLAKLVKQLPVWKSWGDQTRGISPVGLGAIMLYSGDPTLYRPAGLRRRFGLAVFDGKAERRRKGEKAGFIAEAKAALFVAAENQLRTSGEYADSYRFRKALEETKIPESTAQHRHLRALRWVMGALLRDFRRAWAEAQGEKLVA